MSDLTGGFFALGFAVVLGVAIWLIFLLVRHGTMTRQSDTLDRLETAIKQLAELQKQQGKRESDGSD